MPDNLKSFEALLPDLVKEEKVAAALQEQLGDNTSSAVAEMLAEDYSGDGGTAYDIIHDLVSNEYTEVDSYHGEGNAGRFWIDIYRFGPAIWIHAAEFDDVGYFDTVEEADEYAQGAYGEFISRYKESVEKGEA